MADQAVAFHFDLEQQCVVVAVGCGGDDTQPVAAGFTFHPKLLPSAAPKGDEAGLDRFLVAGLVEEAEHQDFAGDVVLHDSGYESVHFFKVDLRIDVHCLSLSRILFGVVID